ncbi:MAG: hypothetical protein KF726_24880 [Anaerolineae bacterium]|nr:hypothetical protein [Anaerolineae bacterium]
MEPGLNDFLGQIPISFIIAPIFFGVLYIIAMVIVFRRAAERRRRRREAMFGYDQPQPTPTRGFVPAMAGAAVAAAAVPAVISSRTALMSSTPPIEEPDLDMLTTNSLLDEAERMPSTPPPAPAPKPTAQAQPAAQPVQSASAPRLMSTEEDPDDAIEVMRIWRDVNDGGLIVQMGNQRYRTLLEVRTPDLQRRFTAVVRDLMNIAGINAGSASGTSAPTPSPSPRSTSSFAPATVSPMPPASPKPVGVLDRVVRRGSSKQEQDDQPPGIAASVEEFLQLRLIATPHLVSRNIHVRPSPDQGIRIEVDGRFYDSVDEVADAEVREYLQTVMAEWASKQ